MAPQWASNFMIVHGMATMPQWIIIVEMTIDDRLERLVERHGALSQSVELALETRELRGAIDNLRVLASQDGENIRALVRIAEIHERRITHLEG